MVGSGLDSRCASPNDTQTEPATSTAFISFSITLQSDTLVIKRDHEHTSWDTSQVLVCAAGSKAHRALCLCHSRQRVRYSFDQACPMTIFSFFWSATAVHVLVHHDCSVSVIFAFNLLKFLFCEVELTFRVARIYICSRSSVEREPDVRSL